jgi:hypothetical protein
VARPPLTVAPGDVLAVRTGGFAGLLIRLGAALLDRPNVDNHIVVVSHTDAGGVQWGVEARPGGVGWFAIADYLGSCWTVTNADQPKTDAQRAAVVKAAHAMLHVAYDWAAIGVDGLEALHLTGLWHKNKLWDGKPPAHVVRSALADYIYRVSGLASPGDGRWTTPGDWLEFIQLRQWETVT